MKSWKDLGFEIETTGDGSPSLRLLQSNRPDREKGESMHHSGGAFSETELIYGTVVRECFDQVEKPHFCVVGLGLGYIELLIAREAIQRKMSFSLTSYEARFELQENFLSFIRNSSLDKEIQDVYASVLRFVDPHQQLKIKEILDSQYLKKDFQIFGGLESSTFPSELAHCVLYDAYSSKTDPHLWDEEFLFHFLQSIKANLCYFSTYASNGNLKRALGRADFSIETRRGFQGKRNSTRAFFCKS